MTITLPTVALAAAALLWPPPSVARAPSDAHVLAGGVEAPSLPPHPLRLSFGRMELAGNRITLRLRAFWDDLQLGIAEDRSDLSFQLAETEAVDAIVLDYLSRAITLEASGTVLTPTLRSRGIQEAARMDEIMWWYELEYEVPGAPPETIHLTNRMLLNLFEDQRNIVHVVNGSTGREQAFYFSYDETEADVKLRAG